MFKLPTCPYCDTVYRYKDVKNIKEKEHTCYHCNNVFKVRKMPYVMILALIVFVLCVGMNLLILFNMTQFNIWVLIVPNFVIVTISVFFVEFFTKFKKKDTDK